jgi:hypothetical protein
MLLAALLWLAEGRRLAAQELVAWMDSPTTLAAVFDTSGARWSERRQRGEVSRRASDSSPVRSSTAVGTSTSATRSCA